MCVEKKRRCIPVTYFSRNPFVWFQSSNHPRPSVTSSSSSSSSYYRCFPTLFSFFFLFVCFFKFILHFQSFFPAMTKIVGTLGPKSQSVEVISACLKAGMSGIYVSSFCFVAVLIFLSFFRFSTVCETLICFWMIFLIFCCSGSFRLLLGRS